MAAADDEVPAAPLSPGRESQDIPDDFYDPEGPEALGFPLTNDVELVRWQRNVIKTMYKGVSSHAMKTGFKPVTADEEQQIRESARMHRVMAHSNEAPADEDLRLTDVEKAEFKEIMLARGTSTYHGPEYTASCALLGFAPNSQTAQIAGSERILRPEQVVSVAFMEAQELGNVPAPLLVPALPRLPAPGHESRHPSRRHGSR